MIWAAIFARFGMIWVMPCTVNDLLRQWRIPSSLMHKKVLWNLSLCAVLWELCLERNSRVWDSY